VNNRIIYPWLTVEINSIGGTEVEPRQQVLTTMTYSVRCYLHLHRMAYRSDGDHALPASPTVCRTYGLLLLGATWHFLYGEATCPVDWLERPGNDWSKVTHVSLYRRLSSVLEAKALKLEFERPSSNLPLAVCWTCLMSIASPVYCAASDGRRKNDNACSRIGYGVYANPKRWPPTSASMTAVTAMTTTPMTATRAARS
jgi:hypothetical protein